MTMAPSVAPAEPSEDRGPRVAPNQPVSPSKGVAEAGTTSRATTANVLEKPTQWKAFTSAALPPAAFLAALLAIWATLSANGTIPSFILPAPDVLAAEFVSNFGVIVKHAGITTFEAASGFIIGNTVAMVMAVVLSRSLFLRECFLPYALMSRAIPMVVSTPLVVILLGRGLAPIIAVVSLSVYFPTFLNMMRGLASADVEYHELLHTLSATGGQKLRFIQLPASMPYLFAALKISASTSFIAALVSEWIGSNAGLGYLVLSSSQYFRLPTMWAAIFSTAILTLILLGLVVLLERLLARWAAAPADI